MEQISPTRKIIVLREGGQKFNMRRNTPTNPSTPSTYPRSIETQWYNQKQGDTSLGEGGGTVPSNLQCKDIVNESLSSTPGVLLSTQMLCHLFTAISSSMLLFQQDITQMFSWQKSFNKYLNYVMYSAFSCTLPFLKIPCSEIPFKLTTV